MDINFFNSNTTFEDIIKYGISLDSNVIKFVRKYLTDQLISNITYDEIFILLIGTITSITIFLKYYNTLNNAIDSKITIIDDENIQEINYSIIFLQNIILIVYAFYIINMMMSGKKHFIITRYSMLINYGVMIITLTVFLYKSKNK